MSGKPVHLRSMHCKMRREGRDGVWESIRTRRTFTSLDIESDTGLTRSSINTYLKALETAGYLERTGKDEQRKKSITFVKNEFLSDMWKLVNDTGVEAPRLRSDGTEVTQGRARDQMWQTIKILNQFTVTDLVVNASTEDCAIQKTSAKEYARYLARAGYLIEVQKGKGHGCGGRQSIYRFVKSGNTGPRAPMIQRVKHVYDPNIGKVVWPKDDEK